MQPKLYLIWLGVWASSCAGPKVDYCIPGTPQYGCSSGAMPKEKAQGMICMNSKDQRSVLRACKLGIGMPEIVICIVNEGGDSLACSDGVLPPAYGDQIYACLRPNDFDRLFIYCKRKKNES